MRFLKSLLLAAALTTGVPATAHEFWISPLIYQVPSDAMLLADIRVGEMMEGSPYSYVPPNFERFEIRMAGESFDVDGRAGDRPALKMRAPMAEGLAVVVHETRDYSLTYRDWAKFTQFTEHKDFRWALDRHRERGLPEQDFKERYSRYGKSLIGVGFAEGSDTEVGLLIEIVAGANPYTDDLSDGFPVTVLFEGAPRADEQVELFEKAPDGSVTSTLHRTDAKGRVTLPVKAGHEYLVDSVLMRELDPVDEGDPVWESLWASLTFKVPG
ncbi:DUF4198 domain-containing protein [Thalassococcus sp. BH17M4-6]|uniref:DUF4198 domain-containing protein n=1 Tax=Thalassococcus sp. BH17M4-6 TaxID=3413148 RepID=UPI003BCEAFE0